MDNTTLLHEIKSGDTLEKIAQKIGMNGNQLKDFHNQNCGKMEKIWFDNLIGIKQIVIPKDYKNPEEILKKLDKKLPSKNYYPTFHAALYEVTELITKTFTPDLEIKYKVEIQHPKNHTENPSEKIVSIKCFDYTKNDEKPDDKISSVAFACMESISPISFLMNQNGSLYQIFNFPELQKKFKSQRKDLEDFYSGEIYQAYFNKFSENLENEKYINKQLLSSPLYQFLFPKLNWFHKTKNWEEDLLLIQSSFPVKCEMNAEYIHEDSDILETILKGRIIEKCSLQELLKGIRWQEELEENVIGEIKVSYQTDKKTKQLLSGEVSISLFHDEELYQKHKVQFKKLEEKK